MISSFALKHQQVDLERLVGFVPQNEALSDDELAEWRHRMCGAVATYGAYARLGLEVPIFSEHLKAMIDAGCYQESEGWIQPYQARYARAGGKLLAVSLTPSVNHLHDVEQNIEAMIASQRLPNDLDSEEVELYRETFSGFRTMEDAVGWMMVNPEWMMIASVEPGYVSTADKHQLLLQSDGQAVYAIDSAGMRIGKKTIFKIDDEFYKYATGNCILLSRKDKHPHVHGLDHSVPFVAYRDADNNFNGNMFHIDMLRTPGILDAIIVFPNNPKSISEQELVVHVQGVRYQEKHISSHLPAKQDEFNVEFANTLNKRGVAFTKLGIHGTGESSGRLDDQSIAERSKALADYLAVLAAMGFDMNKVTLSAQSQGCLVVIRALSENDIHVRKVSLISPVMFSEAAENATFGTEFTEEIRKSGNYRNSMVESRLQRLAASGIQITLTWMEHDVPNSIPKDVYDSWNCIAKKLGVAVILSRGNNILDALKLPKT